MPMESPEKTKLSRRSTWPRTRSESRSHATMRRSPSGTQILSPTEAVTRFAPSTGPSAARCAIVGPATAAINAQGKMIRMSARIAHPFEEVDLLAIRRRQQPAQRRIGRIVPDRILQLGDRDVDDAQVTLEHTRELRAQRGPLELEMIEQRLRLLLVRVRRVHECDE